MPLLARKFEDGAWQCMVSGVWPVCQVPHAARVNRLVGEYGARLVVVFVPPSRGLLRLRYNGRTASIAFARLDGLRPK